MPSNKKVNKPSKSHRKNKCRGKNLNAKLFKAIQKKNIMKVMDLTNYVMQNNKSIDLKHLNASISQADPEILKRIIPHCGFSKSSDLYIPRQIVIKPSQNCQDCVKLLLNWNFIVNPDSKHDKEFVYAAVENGYLPIIVQLSDHGIDVNMVNSATGLNLLTIACVNKHHEIVENLLKHNADVNVIIPSTNIRLNEQRNFAHNLRVFVDVTCLHIAVFNSDPITTKLLLKYGAKIINDPEFFYVTYLAIHNGDEDIFRTFLDYGVNATDIGPQGQTFLHACVHDDSIKQYNSFITDDHAQNSRYNIAKCLLENGANIYLQSPNNSLVFEATSKRHRKTAQLFLDYNPDVQYVSSDGNTALHEAIKNHFDVEFIKTLLKLNSPVNIADDYGFTPFLLACKRRLPDRLEIIEALLHYNANVNCINRFLWTPLHYVCDVYDDQSLELVRLLIEKGANPNVITEDGETPLHYVCKQNSDDAVSIIKLFLQHDVNIEAMDSNGWTPLFIACERNNDVVVQLLLENNAYVNHKDLEKSTPLHISVTRGFLDVAYCLIAHGSANIDILDYNNQTPLQIAEKYLLDSQISFESFRSESFFESGEEDSDQEDQDNKMYLDEIKKYNDIKEILIVHAVKLKVAGLEVNQKIVWKNVQSMNIVVFEGNYTFIEPRIEARFVEEIEQMKMENIGTTNITFYDLLTKNTHFLSRFVKNDIILEALENDFYKTKFLIYINIVRSRFREAKIRYKMMNSAREYFSENVCGKLPDECIDIIFSYLSIDELFIFNGARILSNG